MNKIFVKFLLTGDKFTPELHLKQPRFTYSACGQFSKRSEKVQTFREAVNLNHLHRNELDKTCFAHDAVYFDSKDLAKRTISDKGLKYRACEVSRICKFGGYQRALASMIYKFFDKKTGSGMSINELLAEELYKSATTINQKKKSLYEI